MIFPNFEERQREIFGARVLPDSQEILDQLRADRDEAAEREDIQKYWLQFTGFPPTKCPPPKPK